jgi:CHAT domain-containing protein/tetratricopeptide (TPR) repeat protein
LLSACRRAAPSHAAGAEFEQAEATFEHGDLTQALKQVDSALQEKHLDPDTFWRLRLLKSEIFLWQGLTPDGIALLKPGSFPEPKSAELLARRSMLRGMGETYLQQTDLAERTFRETEAMPGADSLQVRGDLLFAEGRLAAFRHDTAQSESLLKQSLAVAQERDQTFLAGRVLGGLGMLEMQQYHYADAVDRFNASLSVAEKLGTQASIVKMSNNLGWAYLQMGDLDRASDLFEESEKKSEQLRMIADQETAVMNIAAIKGIQHDFPKAREDYQLALKLASQVDDKQRIAFSLNDLAEVAISTAEFNLAEKYNDQALAVERSIGDHDTELSSLTNEAQIAASRADQTTANRLLGEVIQQSKADFNVQAHAYLALAGIDAKLNHVEAARIHYNAAIDSLEKGRLSFGREEFKLSDPMDAKTIYGDYIDFLLQHGMADDAFRVVEMHRASTLTEGLGVDREYKSRALAVAEAKHFAALSGHVILSYWVGPQRSYLWIFTPDHSQLVLLPGEDRLRPLIEQYRAHLMGGFDSDNVANASGQELYSILIAPVERWIKPQSQVTVVADGELCGLNFETLVVSSPKPHYWIEDVAVTNAGSAILLSSGLHSAAWQAPEQRKALLLIGNPRPPDYYPPLSHAGDEIRLVRGHFSPAQETVISGAGATPTAYFQAKPENYSLIHFVAHGTASRESPLDSAVVLSADGESHNLYARDIERTKLHARLVTISACDSAGTKIYSSAGLVGLSWAFLRAGAQKVIAALWEVNDASTPQLMDQMYSAIVAGEEPAAALRDAKLALLHSPSVYRRPFYWAPFVLYEGI